LSKRKRQKRSTSQILFWLLSLIIVISMIISLIIVALEPQPQSAPTVPPPTITPFPTRTPTAAPTGEPTEPVVGPELPTATPNPSSGGFKPVAAAGARFADAGEQPARAVQSPAAEPAPSTAPTEVAELRFAVAGDTHNSSKVYRRLLETVARDNVEFLIHTGDLVYDKGTEAQWQKFQTLMADFPLPFYPVPGNHDGLGGKLDGYLAYSGAPAAHYSFDQGSAHFAFADSHNGGVTAAELDWLRDNLGAASQPLKIVVLHHPPFDPDGTDHVMAFGNNKFMRLMAEMDVDYVFTGHIHAYVRGQRDGVEYVISGGAGSILYRSGHPLAVNHYLRVTVRGQDLMVEMVEV
jgi:predicted phosphodiesterase